MKEIFFYTYRNMQIYIGRKNKLYSDKNKNIRFEDKKFKLHVL